MTFIHKLIAISIGCYLCCTTMACSGPAATAGREPDEYTGCATDELWPIFDGLLIGAQVETSATEGPLFLTPAAGGPLSEKPLFTWQPSSAQTGNPDGDVPAGGDNCEQFHRGEIVVRHLPAISGTLYDLQVAASGTVIYRVITTLQQWTPPDSAWTAWKGSSPTIRLYRVVVSKNMPAGVAYTRDPPLTITVQ